MKGENTLGAVCFILIMLSPAVSLLLLRRWFRRWWVALVGVVFVLPPVTFFVVGGVAWALTYHRVVVVGDTSVPDRNGQAVPQYLFFIFAFCGAYGVLFAATGFALSVPALVAWRLAHPRSFKGLTRTRGPD